MDSLFALSRRISPTFLRISMGVILFWIGALKFADPMPVVGLIQASIFSFLGSNAFVYLLGAAEVVVALLLFAGIGIRYVGLATAALFVGTLTIFLSSPQVTYGGQGFPYLSLPGEFLLKDLGLMAAATMLAAIDSETASARSDSDRMRAVA